MSVNYLKLYDPTIHGTYSRRKVILRKKLDKYNQTMAFGMENVDTKLLADWYLDELDSTPITLNWLKTLNGFKELPNIQGVWTIPKMGLQYYASWNTSKSSVSINSRRITTRCHVRTFARIYGHNLKEPT